MTEDCPDSDTSPDTATVPESSLASFSPIRKRILYMSMCIIQFVILMCPHMPFSYLPLYNEDRNISSTWTGLILAFIKVGWTLSCVAIAPTAIGKFSTRMLFSGSFVCNGILILLYSILDLVKNATAYIILSIMIRLTTGVFYGIFMACILAGYVAIYPQYVGTVSAIGGAVINLAFAFGPFFGGVLYDVLGFILASVVPGAMTLLCIIPVIFLPNLRRKTENSDEQTQDWRSKTTESSHEIEKAQDWKSILDPWVLFPLWHLTSALILFSYHIPLLSPYAEDAFDADVVWSGAALLIGKAPYVVFSPIIGLLIDKFVGPCEMMIASSVSLPVVYIFVGPLPLLSLVTPSKMQVMLSLAFLGFAVAMACIPILPVMFQVYKLRNEGQLPAVLSNWLVSLYSGAFPFGFFIGNTVSGFIAPHASFGWSTGTLGLIYIAQSLLCIVYCMMIIQLKKRKERKKGEELDGHVLENRAADTRQ